MTSGRPFPLIFNFALPLLLGNLLQQTYSLVDAAIVGQFLGINDLAAVGAGTSVVFLILGFCNGCCGGFGIPVAQKFGARDYGTMRRLVSVSLQLAVVMSVVIAIVTSLFCADILKVMRTPETIFRNAYYYLLVTFIGVPCTFFYNLLSSIIRALGDSKTPFWFLLFSTVLNVLLDLFCILVLDWGVTGAAIATVISQGVSAELEKRDDVAINSVTKRDPKTRKVVKVVKSFSLKDENIGARLIEAFEKDEEYAETAIKDMPKGRGKAQKANFTFIYKTDNEKRTYTLNVKESGSVSMTVIISPMKDGQEVGSVVLDPEYWDSFNEQMAELGNNLRDSGIEVRQMSREEMEKMQETIRQSLKGLDAYAIAE